MRKSKKKKSENSIISSETLFTTIKALHETCVEQIDKKLIIWQDLNKDFSERLEKQEKLQKSENSIKLPIKSDKSPEKIPIKTHEKTDAKISEKSAKIIQSQKNTPPSKNTAPAQSQNTSNFFSKNIKKYIERPMQNMVQKTEKKVKFENEKMTGNPKNTHPKKYCYCKKDFDDDMIACDGKKDFGISVFLIIFI